MINAPLPNNEQERLQALQRYNVLDSEAEADFDEIVQLISQICGVPISLVSLIDSDRQWFKSRKGLDVTETPRDQTFCAHAILGQDAFVVPDATKDERFFDNPLVIDGPKIRFYAGMPLTTPDGFNMGTLCVIDDKPRKLTEEQQFALKTLSRQVVTQMELRLKLMKINQALQEVEIQKTIAEESNQKILKSINYGKRIQEAIQPSEEEIRRYLPESFIFNRPKDVVSGDFYYFTQDKYTGKLIIAVADCTGHGVPGAFMSMIGNALLNDIVKAQGVISPDEILYQLEQGIQKNLRQDDTQNQDGLEIAICVIDTERELIEFAASRRDLIIIDEPANTDEEWSFQVYSGDKRAIGGKKKASNLEYTKKVILYRPGSQFYIYTDGITDQFGSNESKKLSKKGLLDWLLQIAEQPLATQKTSLDQIMNFWMNDHKQIDDMLLIGFRCPTSQQISEKQTLGQSDQVRLEI